MAFYSLIRTFARMKETKWCENVILVDADYVDKVAFDLIVNFERMIGRQIPKADMAQWMECVALDGGNKSNDSQTQVVLLHKNAKMDNFNPGDFAELKEPTLLPAHVDSTTATAEEEPDDDEERKPTRRTLPRAYKGGKK